MSKHELRFRAGVGAVIINQEGLVLGFERVNQEGAWQFMQGGMDEGEVPSETAVRELEEETSLAPEHVELLGEHPDWLTYELPAKFRRRWRGQTQRWYLFRLTADESAIDIINVHEVEFGQWKWMTMEEMIASTSPFRQGSYQKLADHFAEYLQ